jgi:hypothetical protein
MDNMILTLIPSEVLKYDGEIEFQYWVSGEELPMLESFT